MSGSGAYNVKDIKNALKPIVKEALSQGGAAIGGLMAPGGAIFGKELGRRLSKIIGSGDYETNTSVNELIHPPGGAASATFGVDGQTIHLKRREFLGDISAPAVPGTFTNVVYPINAGLRRTFPFLSQIADNYEEYCFNGLVFEFISSASPFINNSSLGTIIASMQYNSSSPAFTDKYTMENSSAAISTRLDKNLMYGVECAKGANPQNCYYVRSGGSPLPVTTTDLGNFEIALAPSSTVPANAVIGELWVTYDVMLKRPCLNPDRFGLTHYLRTGISASAPFGTATVSSTIVGTSEFRLSSNTAFSFQNCIVGEVWQMSWCVTGTTPSGGVPVVAGISSTASTGIVAANQFGRAALPYSNQTSYQAGGVTLATPLAPAVYVGGCNTLLVNFCWQCTATSGTVVFDTTGAVNWPAGTAIVEMTITSLGHSIPW